MKILENNIQQSILNRSNDKKYIFKKNFFVW